MNIQGRINEAMASAAQGAVAVGLLNQSLAEEESRVESGISGARDAVAEAEEKLIFGEYDRTDINKYREALQRNLDAKNAAKEQEDGLVAYYRSIYRGVGEDGRIDPAKFRRKLAPTPAKKTPAYSSDADEILEEELRGGKDGEKQR